MSLRLSSFLVSEGNCAVSPWPQLLPLLIVGLPPAVRLAAYSSMTVVVTFFFIPPFHLFDSASMSKIVSSSDSLLPLPPEIIVVATAFPTAILRSCNCCPLLLSPNFLPVSLPRGIPEDRLVVPRDAMVHFTSGLRVAMQLAVMPIPTSTVVQIAKSVVR